MGRNKRYIKLTPTEYDTLKAGEAHHPKSEFRRRCTSLLMSHTGLEMLFICDYFDINQTTLSGWFNAWENKGIAGLFRQPGQGRKPILSIHNVAHVTALDKAAESHYQDVKEIKVALQDALQINMSNDTVKRFLKKIITVGIESDVVLKKDK
jgi:transposase